MKKRSITYLFITILLLFATFFSMLPTPVHTDKCEHTVCTYCEEISATKNAVNAALEEHGDCTKNTCETCVLLKKQIERLKDAAEHSCCKAVCGVCIRIALEQRLRVIVCALSFFALAYETLRITHFVFKEKTPIKSTFTLFALKVKLND